MKDLEFKQGQKLKAIYWPGESIPHILAKNGIDIEVVMENGQMAGVPWALVTYPDGTQTKWNLANCSGVLL